MCEVYSVLLALCTVHGIVRQSVSLGICLLSMINAVQGCLILAGCDNVTGVTDLNASCLRKYVIQSHNG